MHSGPRVMKEEDTDDKECGVDDGRTCRIPDGRAPPGSLNVGDPACVTQTKVKQEDGEDDDEDGGRQELDNGNESDSSEGEKDFGSDENNCSDGEDNRKGQKQTSSQKQRRNKRGGLNTSQEKIEVTLDDIEDDDD